VCRPRWLFVTFEKETGGKMIIYCDFILINERQKFSFIKFKLK